VEVKLSKLIPSSARNCRNDGTSLASNTRAIIGGDEAALTRVWSGVDHSRAQAAKSPTAQAQLLRPLRSKYSRAGSKQRQVAPNLTSFETGIRCFMKAYAILRGKLYAPFSEYPSDQGNRVLVSRAAAHLDIGDRVQIGRLSQISNRPIQRSARHPVLCPSHSHDAVPLLHAAKSSFAWDQINGGSSELQII
jgi:hypothetical protein